MYRSDAIASDEVVQEFEGMQVSMHELCVYIMCVCM